jgi:hypothetical protein
MCEFNPASTESPAFLIESKGKLIPLAYHQFQNKLKQLISLIGLNPLLFSSQSFRRGGASSNNKTLNARLLARVITGCHYT